MPRRFGKPELCGIPRFNLAVSDFARELERQCECPAYSFDLGSDSPDRFDVDLYECDNLRDLAVQFFDDGLFGEITASIQNYLDYDAIARDLAMDYAMVTVGCAKYSYRIF